MLRQLITLLLNCNRSYIQGAAADSFLIKLNNVIFCLNFDPYSSSFSFPGAFFSFSFLKPV